MSSSINAQLCKAAGQQANDRHVSEQYKQQMPIYMPRYVVWFIWSNLDSYAKYSRLVL